MSGRFFVDVNNDGVRNAGARDTTLGAEAFEGAVVELRDAATGDVLATTEAGADGTYSFALTSLGINPDETQLQAVERLGRTPCRR